MSLIFGGGGSKARPEYTGLGVQTSTNTIAVTQSWGYGRQAPNIIWQDDFESHKQKQSSGKGAPANVTYTYSASFIAAVGWGPFSGCDRVWKDQSKESDFTKLGFTLFDGTIPQAPWGYLVANHPGEALGYPGLGYFAVANYDLGNTNVFPQHSFLMRRPLYNTAPGGVGDADVALVTDDFLNNDVNGCLIGSDAIVTDSLLSTADATTTGDNAFQTYCIAMGFGFSPELESQELALDILDRWTQIFNTALIWNGAAIKFLPYGADTITANGVTYLPNFVSQYTLTDADYVFADGADPVMPSRVSPQDVKNSLSLEIKNRSNEYNTVPAPWQDQGLIDQYGPKPDEVFQAHEIKEPTIGALCASLMGNRNAYHRNDFDFSLPSSFMLLEPGDIVTVTDPTFGPVDVMLKEIDEQDDDSFEIVAKEFNGSVVSAGATQDGSGTSNNPIDTGVTASPVNTPMIFQPPPAITGGSPEIWAAVSGGNPINTTADPNWGGCDVYVSTDGGSSFNKVGTIDNPCRMGYLSAGFAAYGGANPDTVNTLKVNVAESAAEFDNATAADAAAAVTLCRIAPEGSNVEEYLSYQNATLHSTNLYWFDHLYRASYGTTAGAHATGAQFARLDTGSIFRYTFPLDLIGSTIHIKFVSFNIFGQGYEDISTVTDYTITIAAGYTYGTTVNGSGDVDVSGGLSTGQYLQWDGTKYVPIFPKYGFGFGPKVPVASKILGTFDSPEGWEVLTSMIGDWQGTIVDSDTASAGAPSAQTDFDIQSPPGTSMGTMRFAVSSLTATFIMASNHSIPLGQIMQVVAPSNLNGITGAITGGIKGQKP